MSGEVDAIVVGAGQAGLAAGFHLRRAGLRFSVLEASFAVGNSWRDRWDSLRLFTPARYDGLPGMRFPGAAEELPGKDAVANYLAARAEQFDLPVRLRTRVTNLRRSNGAYLLTTEGGERLATRAVIVATGANQRPHVPRFARSLRPRIVQLHSSEYRRPSQLPSGPVLVVGAGNSGAQIAQELAVAGREVALAGRPVGSLPRRFLGRDVYDWLWPTLMRPSLRCWLGRRLMEGRRYAGDPLVGIRLSALQRAGVQTAGRVSGVRDGLPVLEGSDPDPGLAAVVWCTGFRPDFGWIELPVFGLDGLPIHERGVVAGAPGLAFLGMRYQFRMGSALLGGVGEDAEYVATEIVRFLRSNPADAADGAMGQRPAKARQRSSGGA
ncbi:MAG: NAD(P)-binding domain-containing protein [Proteobacteria bacterium]|nr:NAD(P)-binding domain-containing protein [Pseudomonadota bacterium]